MAIDSRPVEQLRSPRIPYPGLLITSAFLGVALLCLTWRGIPFAHSFLVFGDLYFALSIQSVLFALLLLVIQFPTDTVGSTVAKYIRSPGRLAILAALVALLFVIYPLRVAAVVSIFAIILLEVYEGHLKVRSLLTIPLPGLYLFLMLIAVFSYNALGVTLRFGPDFDHVLAATDRFLLAGHSVSQLAHSFVNAAPTWLLATAQLVYFSLFAQIGATLIVCALVAGRRRAMQFISTLAIAYLISIIIFFIFPTHSPYYKCPQHSQAQNFEVFKIQNQLAQYATARSHGTPLPLQTEYYIAFPCMHLAQPLIVLWFLRRWRRMCALLVVVDSALTFCIVLLEWHYFTDLLGGIAVAITSIAIMKRYGGLQRWETVRETNR